MAYEQHTPGTAEDGSAIVWSYIGDVGDVIMLKYWALTTVIGAPQTSKMYEGRASAYKNGSGWHMTSEVVQNELLPLALSVVPNVVLEDSNDQLTFRVYGSGTDQRWSVEIIYNIISSVA